MKETLKIAILQGPLAWEDPQANREYYFKRAKAVKPETDLVLMPEMFTTGFTMNPKPFAEPMDGTTVQNMQALARGSGFAIAGSLIIEEDEKYYNRFIFCHPDGHLDFYNKRHLFTLSGEHENYTPGKDPKVIDFEGWKLFPQICYDLRFPVYSRNTWNYDAVIYVANWPEARINAWDILLRARAIENMAYSVGVNRVGRDGNDLDYNGHSAVFDALGTPLAFAKEEPTILYTELESLHLVETRRKLDFLADRDEFTLTEK
ncbi:nitrilase family protein [Croceiramulus getboli]|nr:nitrilase family protein [Flavobacteriaceae bacterium YJPT1-3]